MAAGERGELYSVLTPFVRRDGQPDVSARDEDMHVIAAAPLLLSALERCHAALSHHPGGDPRSDEDIYITVNAINAAHGVYVEGEFDEVG